MKSDKILGVDIGNVIINSRLRDSSEKMDEAGYLELPPTEGVFEALHALNTEFKGEVYLLSKCTEWAQVQILIWLKGHDFYNQTGVDPEKVHFVRERYEKDGICRKIGITHFIDDRLEVLSHMIESTPNLYLFQPDPKEVKEFNKFLSNVTVVNDWNEVLKHLIK